MQVQTYLFYCKFPNDPYFMKALVATMWLLQSLNFFTNLDLAYFHLIRAIKDPLLLSEIPWTVRYLGTHRVFITSLTQTYFAFRLWSYAQDRCMSLLLGVLTTTTLALGIANSIDTWQTSDDGYSHWTQTAWNISIVGGGFHKLTAVLVPITLIGID
ncbi:hypothetical protein DL93DRAFT_490930 [Clavulina sp. PMI_390]|nr:hypothetical protein DL93DRAFT_490930 [Clavulina sp. PMI_390]